MLSIINEIDAYLSRLRLARELLAESLAGAPAKKTRKKSNTKTPPPALSPAAQAPASSRSKVRRSARTSAQKRVAPAVHVLSSPPAQLEDVASSSDALSIDAAETPALPEVNAERLASLPNISVERIPYRGPRGSIRHSHARSLKASEPPHGTGALVGSVNSKIVVVSPEQAKKERERTAQPEVQPRTVFRSGSTGRLAFESLFKDTSDRSN
jgi:hypothetical protein